MLTTASTLAPAGHGGALQAAAARLRTACDALCRVRKVLPADPPRSRPNTPPPDAEAPPAEAKASPAEAEVFVMEVEAPVAAVEAPPEEEAPAGPPSPTETIPLAAASELLDEGATAAYLESPRASVAAARRRAPPLERL